jgi:hypothetical protein
MFFVDPTAAFTNLRTAMRPGGRLLFAAWRPLTDNPWFTVPLEAAREFLPPQPPVEPDAPGPFALADDQRVRRILTAAGWRDGALVRHDVPIRIAAPGNLEQATEFATSVGPLSRALAEVDPDLKSRVRAAVAQALKTVDGPDGVSLRGSIWLVSARA